MQERPLPPQPPTPTSLSKVLTSPPSGYVHAQIARSTMVYRDKMVSKLLGYDERSAIELAAQRKIWAASTAMSMYTELVSIITCRTLYVAFRPHRFVINFGYGFDASDAGMASTVVILSSTGIELFFEGLVDALALDVEAKNGVDLNKFWNMWRSNAAAFWSVMLANGAISIAAVIWAFRLIPNVAFCTSSTDVCSCNGAGFEIFAPFCNATTERKFNNNGTLRNGSTVAAIDVARSEYQSFADALGVDGIMIAVSVGTGILIIVVFVVVSHSCGSQ